MAGAVHVQDHVVLAAPLGDRLDRGPADDEIDHHDDRAQFLGELGAAVHLLHRAGGDVEVVALDLAGLRRRHVDRLHAVQEAVAPMHERLRVDVLVVLHEVEAALEALVHHAAVVLARQAELRLGGGAEQRLAELVETLALADDAGRRALERLEVGDRQAHVLEARGLQRLEREHVADDRRREVGDRAFLEQDDVVGDVAEVLARRPRNRIDAIGLGAILVAGGQPVGPHHGPRRGRAFAGHGGGSLDRIDAVLRRDAEQRDEVGVLGHIVALPVAHLRILQNASLIACCTLDFGLLTLAHGGAPFRVSRVCAVS